MKKILLSCALDGVYMGVAIDVSNVAHAADARQRSADWFKDMTDRVMQQNNPARLVAVAKCIEEDNLRRRSDNIRGDNMSSANQLHMSKPRNEIADIQYNWCLEAAKRNNPNPGE